MGSAKIKQRLKLPCWFCPVLALEALLSLCAQAERAGAQCRVQPLAGFGAPGTHHRAGRTVEPPATRGREC